MPVFVLDPAILRGRFPSPARAAFLHGCLRELDASLRRLGGGLVIREGRPWEVLPRLVLEAGADTIYWADDVSPYARVRDERVRQAVARVGPQVVVCPGNFAADVSAIQTTLGNPYKVFTPFYRAWIGADRRAVEAPPAELSLPSGIACGRLPSAAALSAGSPPPRLSSPGEPAGRETMECWLEDGVADYAERHDRLAGGTSRLSPYLHFGCVSVRELEHRVAARNGDGPAAYRRQLCWRDFYAHVLLFHPEVARHEMQQRYRALEWAQDAELLDSWQQGQTGYPLVDAGMRELLETGWMHNRARLVVGSFLTKDLHLDWRAGEQYFMARLIDGDEANNNGNWQWIASVGTDSAPYFRRLLNPVSQQRRHDPDGEYVRRWVPELRDVPDAHIAEPWRMSDSEQHEAGCVIGSDYPSPIVDHAVERRRAMERYRAAAAQ